MGAVVMWWVKYTPLVVIGLTDLPKSGGAVVSPAPITILLKGEGVENA